MNTDTTFAIDLGKHSFYTHEQSTRGQPVYRKKFNRAKLMQYMAQHPPCRVVMEACGGSHFMARELAKLGHYPQLIAAQFVRPLVKSNKNDFADAEAICETALIPTTRFVAVKTEEQQVLALLNTTREAFVKDRTATVNRIQAALLEMGISLDKGFAPIRELPVLLDELSLPLKVKRILMTLHAHFNYLTDQLKALTKEVECQAAESDLASRLMTIPCIGPITSTALAAELGDGKQFKCGRDYSASIGLVPKQHGTGGKTRLLGISKRGDPNQRRLLIQCAWVYLKLLDRQTGTIADWVRQMLRTHNRKVVVCGLANKLGRVAWSLTANHTVFEAGPSVMNA